MPKEVKRLKGKTVTILALVAMLCMSIPTAFSKNDNFGVDYTFEPVMVGGLCEGCGNYLIEDTQIYSVPGEPLVPYRAASILLPQGAELKDVKVKHGKPIVMKGFDLPWGQPPCTFSDTPVQVGRNEETYNSNDLYPKTLFQVVGVESFRGYDILNLLLFPVQYQPKSGTVHFYKRLTVEVQFGKGMKNKLYRGLEEDKAAVADIVDNTDTLSTYESEPVPLATEEYIIITNDALQSTFQQLATWKAGFVNGASVYTVSWITSNYSGSDTQMKIRNFIIDKYTNNGTLYVLLGGDTGVVPYRGFYVSTGGYTDSDMAADMYYAHLDGSHNADGDSHYGETNDNVDFYAEVAVGRAPVDNTTEAQTFVNKVIAYEQMDKPKRVCLHESRVGSGNSPDARCLAYNCDNYIPGDYTIDYLFEEDGNVSKADWRAAWAANPVAVVHIGHGNTTVYYINYEVGGTVSWYTTDVSSLTNTFYPWTTSVACICGQFEASDCLSEYYVKDDCGAIGAIYNDNYGWFMTDNACALSGEFCEMEVRACWSDGYQKLGDILNRSRYYLASSAQSDTYYRWCFYERNLMGDPETPCLTKRGVQDTVTITNPSEGETVSGTVSVTTSTTGAIDEVRFYIDGTLVKDDTSSPFNYTWDTTAYSNGSHTILVEGYVSGTLEDTDSVTVTVDNISYYVTITNPSEGETVAGTVNVTTDTNCDEVRFYIDGTLVKDDTSSPFDYTWDTTGYSNGDHTILAEGYASGTLVSSDSVTVTVDNISYYVTITNPSEGATVSGTVNVTTDTNCDEVRFYIDGTLVKDDTSSPFDYAWDTTAYSDGGHTILVEGYVSGTLEDTDSVTVTVENITYYVTITNPTNGSTVSGTVNVTTNTNCDEVRFYIDGTLVKDDTSSPFDYTWDTTAYSNGNHTILVEGYASGTLKDTDSVTVTVENITYYVTITNPTNGSTVSGTVIITVDTNCDEVRFYIDGTFVYDDTSSPFQYTWDTTAYPDGNHTIMVEGYVAGVLKETDSVTVTVDNVIEYNLTITNPTEGEVVSNTVTITTDTNCSEVRFYIDGSLVGTDTTAPFQYSWDTTAYSDGDYTILAEGYVSGTLEAQDTVTCEVSNGGSCLGTTLVSLLVLFGSAAIYRRR
jgi:hypothetical protein